MKTYAIINGKPVDTENGTFFSADEVVEALVALCTRVEQLEEERRIRKKTIEMQDQIIKLQRASIKSYKTLEALWNGLQG